MCVVEDCTTKPPSLKRRELKHKVRKSPRPKPPQAKPRSSNQGDYTAVPSEQPQATSPSHPQTAWGA